MDTRLDDLVSGRDNNLNLIRFLAATAVLVSHAFPISLGGGTAEPLKETTGHTLGGLAVFVFFAISGFLVTASYARNPSPGRFLAARALRLFPGLAVSLVFVALLLGPFVTSLPASDYLAHPDTAAFILRNMMLAFPQYTLPGVFTENPYPAVEGSIWTLVHEVLCYSLVFAVGVTGILRHRQAMSVALALYALLWAVPQIVELPIHRRIMQTYTLSLPFVVGVAFWHWRDRIRLSGPLALASIALAMIARQTPLAFPVLVLALTYATFWLAYVPRGRLRQFNRLGDYSYGIYIYAFPLQGFALWFWGPMDPITNIALALPLTLICAMLSWHFVERPALGLLERRRHLSARMDPLR